MSRFPGSFLPNPLPGLLLLLLCFAPIASQSQMVQLVQNGNFGDGLAGWESSAGVGVENGTAVLDDGFVTALWQVLPMEDVLSLTYRFSIRWDGLSSVAPLGTFPDFFAASLEFSDDPDAFSVFGGGVAGVSLFQVDARTGPRNQHSHGSLLPDLELGNEWMEFSLTVVPTAAYAAPFFRLFEANFQSGDSSIALTNVSVSAVLIPEPAAAGLLFGVVFLLAVWGRRWRNRSRIEG